MPMADKPHYPPPVPCIRRRDQNPEVTRALISQGVEPALARFLAARVDGVPDVSALSGDALTGLPNPDQIPDMRSAVARIVAAIEQGESVVFAVDHDMDGQASAAVLWLSFTDYFGVTADKLMVVSSHRLREGYGITAPVVQRILERNPGLVISADKGSSDETQIAVLKAAGIDVIITDHHAVPEEGPPASALACVNPARQDSAFDATVCGAAVAFFCMARVRSALVSQQPGRKIPSLTALLDFVAVATIADCVSLRPDRAAINRILVRVGLKRINAATRPCWQVFLQAQDGKPVDSQSVAFQLAPAVAAAGRLDWADTGFAFLTAPSRPQASLLWQELQAENTERKAVEKRIRLAAQERVEEHPLGASIAVFLEDGHSGVHGITASRLVERYGRPAVVFAPRGQGMRTTEVSAGDDAVEAAAPEEISGSFRSVPGLHIRDLLQDIADEHPGLLLRFGGHAGAAGASMRRESFPKFAAVFEKHCQQQLGTQDLTPIIWVDDELSADEIGLDVAENFARLDPWGRDFPAPQFIGAFIIDSLRAIGDGTHLKLGLSLGSASFDAVWFSARHTADSPMPVCEGQTAEFVYKLEQNHWRGRIRLQLQIVSVVAGSLSP